MPPLQIHRIRWWAHGQWRECHLGSLADVQAFLRRHGFLGSMGLLKQKLMVEHSLLTFARPIN